MSFFICKNLFKIIEKAFVEMLFPAKCNLCRVYIQENNTLCYNCWNQISFIEEPFCEQCGDPMRFVIESKICPKCTINPNFFNTLRSVCEYNDITKRLIVSAKFGDKIQNLKLISKIMINKFSHYVDQNWIIIPLSLHKKSLRERKFNQSAMIAKDFAIATGAKFDPMLITKHKYTKKQSTLDHDQRMTNVKNSFRVNAKIAMKYDRNRHYKFIIIDDVTTTGSTLNECARILKKHFPSCEIKCLTFAKTVM